MSMSNVRAKLESKSLAMGAVLPTLLGVNVMALFALDLQNGIPQWIKLAASLFLQF